MQAGLSPVYLLRSPEVPGYDNRVAENNYFQQKARNEKINCQLAFVCGKTSQIDIASPFSNHIVANRIVAIQF